jgi:RNA ligase (TIGR02306 family)
MEKHKWRVRMARFKGVPSECLIVSGAPDMPPGTDLTDALSVTKYEKPIPVGITGEMAGPFPSFIPKTDEPNFQAVDGWETLLARGDWYATEKADGTSCTVWNDDAGLHVCSRNWELREFTASSGASNAYWLAARRYKMDALPQGYGLQFEVVGPGIQGNPMGLKALEARAFNLYDIASHRHASADKLREIAALTSIPLAMQLPIEPRAYSADELRKLAEIKYANGRHGEGIVIRANDSSWSMKVLNLLYKD